MMQEVRSSLEEVDVVLHLVDSSVPWGGGEDFLFGLLGPVACRVLGVLTKVDLVRPKDALLPLIDEYRRRRPETTVVPISAISGDGLEALLTEMIEALPEGHPMYPEDLATTQTERFFVAELVREKLLAHLRSELPYSTGVVVDFFEESESLLRINAVIYVERPSQKGIVIGRGGGMIKAVGSEAREELERLLGIRIYLDLRVKVHRRWRDDTRVLLQMEPGMADLGEGDS
jgi:GTP-binding protein Era